MLWCERRETEVRDYATGSSDTSSAVLAGTFRRSPFIIIVSRLDAQPQLHKLSRPPESHIVISTRVARDPGERGAGTIREVSELSREQANLLAQKLREPRLELPQDHQNTRTGPMERAKIYRFDVHTPTDCL